MILVDTSIWADHLRGRDSRLTRLLELERVILHDFVIGELALGNLNQRREILTRLAQLPRAPTATDAEVLFLIDQHNVMGTGIGYVDAHLLAAAKLKPGLRLWSRDRRLAAMAERLAIGFDPEANAAPPST